METTAATLKQEIVDELLKNVQTPDQLFGPDGPLHQLKGALMERMLEAEMTAHLGFDKNDSGGQGAAGNPRKPAIASIPGASTAVWELCSQTVASLATAARRLRPPSSLQRFPTRPPRGHAAFTSTRSFKPPRLTRSCSASCTRRARE
jgi:hypothetical protein